MRLRAITFWVLIPLALLVLGANLAMNLSIRSRVEAAGQALNGAPVKLAYSSLSFVTGNGGWGPMEAGNAPGYRAPLFVKVKGCELSLSVSSLWSDHLRVQHMTVEAPVLYLEQREGASNLDFFLTQWRQQADPVRDGVHSGLGNTERLSKLSLEKLTLQEGIIRLVGEDGKTVIQEIPLPKTMEIPLINNAQGNDPAVILLQLHAALTSYLPTAPQAEKLPIRQEDSNQ